MKIFILFMTMSIGSLWMQFWCDFKLHTGFKLTRAEETFLIDQDVERLENSGGHMTEQFRDQAN